MIYGHRGVCHSDADPLQPLRQVARASGDTCVRCGSQRRRGGDADAKPVRLYARNCIFERVIHGMRLAQAVMRDMRRAVKERHGLASVAPLHAGVFTAVQRFRSDLGLYVHLITLVSPSSPPPSARRLKRGPR